MIGIWSRAQIEVEVVSTEKAKHFFDSTRLNVKCHFDKDEWVSTYAWTPCVYIVENSP